MSSAPIHAISTVSGNQPRIRRIVEDAGETFLSGTPVQLTAGFVAAWDGTTEALGIAGFSLDYGADLAVSGVAEQPTSGVVPNQPDAQNILRPVFNDGRSGFEVANDDSVFSGQVGPAQSVTQANVGLEYGLTIDSDGHWYVDLTDTTDVVVRIVKLDPNDQAPVKRGVYFIVIPSAQQLQA